MNRFVVKYTKVAKVNRLILSEKNYQFNLFVYKQLRLCEEFGLIF